MVGRSFVKPSQMFAEIPPKIDQEDPLRIPEFENEF